MDLVFLNSSGTAVSEFTLSGAALGAWRDPIGLHGRSIEMRAGEITGGCLCGDVRFHASGAPRRVTHCHCDMCRRAVGAVVATFATFESSRVEWRGPLSRYDSSDRAWRGFCPRCGSSLCFGYKPRPDRIYVTLGTFDDPNAHPGQLSRLPRSKAQLAHHRCPPADCSERKAFRGEEESP